MLSLVFVVLFLFAHANCICTVGNCQGELYNSLIVKANTTSTIKLGILLDDDQITVDRLSMAKLAVDAVNNDTSILKNTQLQLYPVLFLYVCCTFSKNNFRACILQHSFYLFYILFI